MIERFTELILTGVEFDFNVGSGRDFSRDVRS